MENEKKVISVGLLVGTKKPARNDIKLLDDKIKVDWSKKGDNKNE